MMNIGQIIFKYYHMTDVIKTENEAIKKKNIYNIIKVNVQNPVELLKIIQIHGLGPWIGEFLTRCKDELPKQLQLTLTNGELFNCEDELKLLQLYCFNTYVCKNFKTILQKEETPKFIDYDTYNSTNLTQSGLYKQLYSPEYLEQNSENLEFNDDCYSKLFKDHSRILISAIEHAMDNSQQNNNGLHPNILINRVLLIRDAMEFLITNCLLNNNYKLLKFLHMNKKEQFENINIEKIFIYFTHSYAHKINRDIGDLLEELLGKKVFISYIRVCEINNELQERLNNKKEQLEKNNINIKDIFLNGLYEYSIKRSTGDFIEKLIEKKIFKFYSAYSN
jgi:hypothetical protein